MLKEGQKINQPNAQEIKKREEKKRR